MSVLECYLQSRQDYRPLPASVFFLEGIRSVSPPLLEETDSIDEISWFPSETPAKLTPFKPLDYLELLVTHVALVLRARRFLAFVRVTLAF